LKKKIAKRSRVVVKGRKSMLARSKPKENHHIYKLFGFQQSGSIEKSERMEEFNEEDIWDSIDAETSEQVGFKENGCNGVAVCRSMAKDGNNKNNRRSVMIHRKESYREENDKRRMRYQSSAPVNIPDWSQMSWEEKKNGNCWSRSHGLVDDDSSDDDEGGDCERNMIPPHELIARQLARTEITPFSVNEGVGRTLKSRDALWTITGFD
jgi:hypothetical protein